MDAEKTTARVERDNHGAWHLLLNDGTTTVDLVLPPGNAWQSARGLAGRIELTAARELIPGAD